jgi:hypothetical protein
MQKNKNRQGLALGAVFAMVASLFVMTSPAQAADETSAVAFPTTGLSTQTTTLIDQGFDLSVRFGTGVGATYRTDKVLTAHTALFGFIVTKPADVGIIASVSGAAAAAGFTGTNPGIRSGFNPINGISTSTVLETAGTEAVFGTLTSGSPVVTLSIVDGTSVSASVAITVTPFLDLNSDGDRDSGEPLGTAVVINFVPWSALGATVALEQTVVGDRGSTVSFAVTANAAVNWTQLDAGFYISASHLVVGGGATNSALISGAVLAGAVTAPGGSSSAGAYSASFKVITVAYSASTTTSAAVWYKGQILTQTGVMTATPNVVDGVTVSPVTGVNIVRTNVSTADARINSGFSVTVYPYGPSITTSVAVASAFTVSSVANVEFSALAGVILDGTTYTSSAAFAKAGFVVAANGSTIPLTTFGQTGNDGTIALKLTSQLQSATLTITLTGTVQVPAYVPTAVAGLAGAEKSFTVTAKDQWGVSSARTDQRIAASVKLGSTTSLTVSEALVNGVATVTLAPTPATGTGSAVVSFTLQTLNQSTQTWEDTTTRDTASWNIYTYTAGSDAFTSRKVSVSGTISYGVALSWSDTVSVVVVNSFSDIVVSAPGLMIQNDDQKSATASDTLTVAASGQTANLRFTSRLAGTYTVTFTSGTATTTSTVIVSAATGDAGSTLTFDKASIVAGETTTITGTLLDVNGNPVMTSGSANVSVAWTGKGLPFGNTSTMETDADGKLTFQVLVLSTEMGDAAIAATYKPAGLTVSTKNVSVVYAVAVGKAVASATKVNAGSFNGYVAVYALGHKGSEISWKIAGKWFKTTVTSDYQVFIRKTVDVGADVNVDIYITAPGGTAVKMLTKVVTTR